MSLAPNNTENAHSKKEIAISIIIPCWRDDAILQNKAWDWADLPHVSEVLIATASSDTCLQSRGNVQIIPSIIANRGLQMNLAAEKATGDVFLFHHADSDLSAAHLLAIAERMHSSQFVGGAFHRAFDERHSAFQWISHFERWRNQRFGSLFGDQSIFVKSECFRSMTGYRDYPLMEDMEFSRRLRRSGKIVLLDPPIVSSARRHQARGAWKTSLQNGLFICLYHFGVSPNTLHRWYYSAKKLPISL